MSDLTTLDNLRKDIRRVTSEIIRMAGERTRLVRSVGEEKIRLGIPVTNREVERKLRIWVRDLCGKHDVDVKFGMRILNQLLEDSKRVQRELMGLNNLLGTSAVSRMNF